LFVDVVFPFFLRGEFMQKYVFEVRIEKLYK